MVIRVLAILLGALMATPSCVFAWGKDGHDLVGKIADKLLVGKTRSAVNELVQGSQFQGLADGKLPNWADAIRASAAFNVKYKGMAKWHFIDVDVDADLAAIKLADFCGNGDCALGALKRFQKTVADPGKPIEDRREALFFIVHFIGDIHQPLHCAERKGDRGGNLVHVRVLGGDDPHTTNLHRVWDDDLVLEAMGGLSTTDYANRLATSVTKAQRKQIAQGTIEDWILESHKIAREKAYLDGGMAVLAQKGHPFRLSNDYMSDRAEVVELQLTKGGIRLAQFLNDTFK